MAALKAASSPFVVMALPKSALKIAMMPTTIAQMLALKVV